MILVGVQYKPNQVPSHIFQALTQALPEIVASVLHDEDDLVSVDQISVNSEVAGRFPGNLTDLDISIQATAYPGRLANLDDRRHTIVERIRTLLASYTQNITCGVSVALARTSYEKL